MSLNDSSNNSHMQVNGIHKIIHSNASSVKNADFVHTDSFHQIPAVFPWFEEKMKTYP